MEFHPILERGILPKSDLWYVLSGAGDAPSMRIGHTCTHIVHTPDSNGKLYLIGGANPNGAFAEVYVFDLDSHVWDFLECPGLKARYEHSAFVPSSLTDKIYLFGGADQYGSFNDVQVFDTVTNSCSSVVTSGVSPSPRTFHNGACVGDKLIVYSGGESGSNPVGDRQAYIFDSSNNSWSTIHTTGNPPKPRLGHLMAAVGDKVYLHGGMAGMSFYGDLHILDLARNSWTAVRQKKVQPPPRTGHGGFVSGTDIFIFGGMNHNGALDDMYKFDTVTTTWTRIETEGSTPSNRLDFACCVIHLKLSGRKAASEKGDANLVHENVADASDLKTHHDTEDSAQSSSEVAEVRPANELSCSEDSELSESLANCSLEVPSPSKDETQQIAITLGLVSGGTDTEGEIFEDTFVFLLRTK